MSDINSKIFNTKKTDYTNPSLFLGEDAGLLDTVNKQYPKIWSLYKTMKSLDWDENEFDYTSCNVEFKTCPKSTYDMMIKTLAWQWEADSIAARAIAPVVASFVTSSELWAAWQRVSDNECLVEGTEVLTPNGWMELAYVTPITFLAQYNPETGSIEFVRPTDYIEKHYTGTVYEFSDQQGHFHQVVTPKHRMLKVDGETGEYQVQLAEEMEYSEGDSGLTAGNLIGSQAPLNDFERLLIAIKLHGRVGEREGANAPVYFSLSEDEKIAKLQSLVDSTGLASLIEQTTSPYEREQRNFKLDIPIALEGFLKNFNWVDLSEKGEVWCKQFLDEFLHWSGHRSEDTAVLLTTSRQAVEICQAAAALCGMTTQLRFQLDNRKESFGGQWRLSWKEQNSVSGQVIVKTARAYDGMVRCVTVPSGFFLVRYRNSVSITGNCIHAATYSEIVKNSFDDPSVILDEVLRVQESLSRLGGVAAVMAESYKTSHLYALGMVENNQETYNAIFMFTVAMLVLERIQFMASFAVTFAICDTGLFQPIGRAVQKIAQDELEVHVELDKAILENELKTERGKIAYEQCKDRIEQLVEEVVSSELEWVDYLFSEGRELVGINDKLLKQWVLYCASDVYSFLKLTPTFTLPKKNPLRFMENWLNIGKSQPSPQEEQVAQYKVNVMRRNDDNEEFDLDF